MVARGRRVHLGLGLSHLDGGCESGVKRKKNSEAGTEKKKRRRRRKRVQGKKKLGGKW